MKDPSLPPETIFVDRDPATGEAVSASFPSIDDLMQREYPIPEHLPAPVREQLEAARQYFAMAYDQSNIGRFELYPTLVSDSFVKAMRAFELALRERLGCNPKTALADMIKLAQAQGILASADELEQRSRGGSHIWPMLVNRKARRPEQFSVDPVCDRVAHLPAHLMRNDIVHGNPDPEMFGPATAHLFGFLLRTIIELLPEPKEELQESALSPPHVTRRYPRLRPRLLRME